MLSSLPEMSSMADLRMDPSFPQPDFLGVWWTGGDFATGIVILNVAASGRTILEIQVSALPLSN